MTTTMLMQKAIDRFIARPRKDYRPYMKWTREQADGWVKQLQYVPPLYAKLKLHQRVCFVLGVETKSFAFFNDTGTGKTIVSLALMQYFRGTGELRKLLILVPRRVNKWEWVREIKKHAPDTSYLVLRGSSKHKWEALQSTDATVVIETYPGLSRLLCDLLPVRRPTKKKRNELVPNRDRTHMIAAMFQGLVMDESHGVANYRALPFRLCRQIAKQARMVYALTGTPFGRDPQMLWAQMYLVDDGETLGQSIGLYRAVFFKQRHNGFAIEYLLDRKKKGLLHKVLANRSIRYLADQADLPHLTIINKRLSLPATTNDYYRKVVAQLREGKGDFVITKNSFLRMRQLSSGFVGYEDDETGQRAQLTFPDNPKLDMLMSLLEGIEQDYKVIVFIEFHHSIEVISRELAKRKINYLTLYGETKAPEEVLHRFDNDDNVQVLLLSNAMAAGLNLQVAKYGIYYEIPVSPIVWQQTRRRIERQESKHKSIFIYYLIMLHTVDQQMIAFHKQGRDLWKAILEGKVDL